MKYLILFLTILAGCGQEYTFEVYTNNKHIKAEEFVIRDESGIIEIGTLPLTIIAEDGETLIAEFEAHVSNFGSNYPQCNCKTISTTYFKCAENFTVNGKDWEIAK